MVSSVGLTCEPAWWGWSRRVPCGCSAHTQIHQGCRDGTAPHRWRMDDVMITLPTKLMMMELWVMLTLWVLVPTSLHAQECHTHVPLREMRYPFQRSWVLKDEKDKARQTPVRSMRSPAWLTTTAYNKERGVPNSIYLCTNTLRKVTWLAWLVSIGG